VPGYDVIITSHSGQHRYEVIRRPGHTGPWCIISADPLRCPEPSGQSIH
jgi:hypothetical protein